MTDKLKQEDASILITTLEDLGPNLPIGFANGNEFLKEFEFKTWKFKEEKQIGKIRENAKGLTVGEFVRHLMSVMLIRIGPHLDFQSLSDPEKTVILSQMYMPDMLYSYIWLRVHSLGPELPMKLKCPTCKYEFDYEVDLKTLEVKVLLEPKKLKKEINLKDGFQIHKELRKKLTIRPPLWSIMDDPQIARSDNPGERDAAMIKGSVVGAEGLENGKPIAILDTDLDEMSKFDIVTTVAAIEDTPGPNMVLEADCPKCKTKFFQMIEWFYDSFFTISSQSQIGRN